MTMYEYEETFGFTENEALFDAVSFKRLKELIERADKVTDFDRDVNSYGEYRFVTLVIDNEAVTFYGHGWHEYRERYLVDEWKFYHGDSFDTEDPPLATSKAKILKYLDVEHGTYEIKREKNKRRRSERAHIFSSLADVGDEDGAMSALNLW